MQADGLAWNSPMNLQQFVILSVAKHDSMRGLGILSVFIREIRGQSIGNQALTPAAG
jgi:hypothetical protein